VINRQAYATITDLKKLQSPVFGILNMTHTHTHTHIYIYRITWVITDRNEGLLAAATVGEGKLCVLNNLL